VLAPVISRAAPQSRVLTGLDRVVASKGEPFLGKRVGLLVHAASLTAGGRHAIDALTTSGVKLVKLFGAEHGFRGLAAAGETVDDGVDPLSGLPVISLYGKKAKPLPEDLDGIDVFVVDLQDAGVRFYTYAATMLHCLDACGAAGLPMSILDRPNPIGGQRVEGPLSAPESEVPRSLVNMTPGPLVHGLTLAEIARVANASREKKAPLSTVELEGWSRAMTWSETGLTWTNPSPNLRSPDACLAYPGTCLIEGTTATEGRGTDAPFLTVGAPWLKAAELARAVRVRGFTCEPTTFTPRSSTATPSPKHMDVRCEGLDIRVTDAQKAEPYRLGVTLLVEMKKRHPEFAWLGDGSGFDRLVGTRSLRAAIDRGESVDAIVARDASAIVEFRRTRAASLLY
jgi:beta-N-acetylhexosaminidase